MKNITPVLIHRPSNLISKGIRLVTGSYPVGATDWVHNVLSQTATLCYLIISSWERKVTTV